MDQRSAIHPVPFDVETLAEAVRSGAQPQYLVLPDWAGAPPLGWVAPWTPTPFATAGGLFRSGGHHFMRGKALLFGDQAIADGILRATSAGQARELGRRVRGFREEVWIGMAARRGRCALWSMEGVESIRSVGVLTLLQFRPTKPRISPFTAGLGADNHLVLSPLMFCFDLRLTRRHP
jgi:hypothetical protein